MITLVTGGIGSGKSEVIKILKQAGKKIIKADEINAELLNDKNYLEKLEKIFPEAFFDGILNKRRLKEIIFSDNSKREILNSIAHPEIIKRLNKLTSSISDVYVEIPLMEFYKGLKPKSDRIWLVTSGINERVERVCKRDFINAELAEKIMKSQSADADLIFDEIIENNGTIEELKDKVLFLAKI